MARQGLYAALYDIQARAYRRRTVMAPASSEERTHS